MPVAGAFVSGIVLVLVVWNRMVPTHLGEAFVKGMSDDVVVMGTGQEGAIEASYCMPVLMPPSSK